MHAMSSSRVSSAFVFALVALFVLVPSFVSAFGADPSASEFTTNGLFGGQYSSFILATIGKETKEPGAEAMIRACQ